MFKGHSCVAVSDVAPMGIVLDLVRMRMAPKCSESGAKTQLGERKEKRSSRKTKMESSGECCVISSHLSEREEGK